MATFDLDALRAEANDEPKTVRLGGRDYTLPPKLPLALAQLLIDGRTLDAIRVLFGDDAEPVERSLTDDELSALAQQLYGVLPGEVRPAPVPSHSNGAPSKRTSPATTTAS